MTTLSVSPNTGQQTQKALPWFKKPALRRAITGWLFILPILLVYVMVVVAPSLTSVYYALTDWSGIGPAEFTGLDNIYTMVMDDTKYYRAFSHNLIWLVFFMTIPFAMALLAAGVLGQIKRGALGFRLALFIPYIFPSVVTAFMWRILMSPSKGLGAQLAAIGIPGLDHAWLGDPNTSLLSIAFVDNWHFWGFLMILFLTAMQGIPAVLYDAARIDGANRLQEFIHVTLPGIRPTLVFMLMMVAIWSFLTFDYVWVLTQGGPAGSSEILGTYLYKQAFLRFEAGYAAAIGLSISLFAAFIVGLFTILRRIGWEI